MSETGPYIVTTSMASMRYGANGKRITTPLSRVAVATLEDVREAVWEVLLERMDRPTWAGKAFPESGGTITLPDGTVIAVECVTWEFLTRGIWELESTRLALARLAAEGDTGSRKLILDAFNAQETKR